MAKSGSVIYNKVTLDTFEFRQTREDTGGALLQFDDYHPPNGIGPLPHRHPLQEEAFTVLNGTLAITIDGTEKVVEDGGKVAVPPNAVHFWRNAGRATRCAFGRSSVPRCTSKRSSKPTPACRRSGR
jgi:mannose-6-phosphate isomerase-like protein (cupin superfamily)